MMASMELQWILASSLTEEKLEKNLVVSAKRMLANRWRKALLRRRSMLFALVTRGPKGVKGVSNKVQLFVVK